MDEQTIKNQIKIEQHDKDIIEMKSDIKELKEKNSLLTELSLSIKTLAENLKDVKQTVTDIKTEQVEFKTEISELRQIPNNTKAKIYDKILIAIGSAIGGGLLIYILNALFPTVF